MRLKNTRAQHDEEHKAFIRTLPCVSCGDNTSTEAAHLRSADLRYGKEHGAMQKKPGDRWVLPLCSHCHRVQHQGNEIEFWKTKSIDPFRLAIGLHEASGNINLAMKVMTANGCRLAMLFISSEWK